MGFKAKLLLRASVVGIEQDSRRPSAAWFRHVPFRLHSDVESFFQSRGGGLLVAGIHSRGRPADVPLSTTLPWKWMLIGALLMFSRES